MTTNLDSASPERQKPFWFKVGQALLLVALVVAFFMLGLIMVHNRFFQGCPSPNFHPREMGLTLNRQDKPMFVMFEGVSRPGWAFRMKRKCSLITNRHENACKLTAKGNRAHSSRCSFSALTADVRSRDSGNQIVAMM
jgi:hypothetical protein